MIGQASNSPTHAHAHAHAHARARAWRRTKAIAAGVLAAALLPLCGTAQASSDQGQVAMLTALAMPSARQAPVTASFDVVESEMRQAWQSALWPADIARLTAAYVERYPQQSWASEAEAQQVLARRTAELLRQPPVQLFKRAFASPQAQSLDAGLLRQAALGDSAAALTLAQQVAQQGDARQSTGWLQLASELGNERAAYALALQYRRSAQPWLASQYEARAVTLGFEPPMALSHLR